MINLTEIKTTKRSLLDLKSNMLVMGLFEGSKLNANQRKFNEILSNQILNAIEMDGFTGEKNTKITLYGNSIINRVHIVGLGKKNKFSTDFARSVGSEIIQFADNLKIDEILIEADSLGIGKNNMAQSFSEGLVMGSYSFNEYKSDKSNKIKVKHALVYGKVDAKSLEKGRVLGESVCFARDLGNHPANILTPTYLAKSAKNIANNHLKM